jgi:hypothetical protein
MTAPKTDAPTLQERLRYHKFHGTENVLHRTRRWTVERMEAADALAASDATIAALVEALDDITGRAEFARSYQDDKFNFGWLTRNARAALAKARTP